MKIVLKIVLLKVFFFVAVALSQNNIDFQRLSGENVSVQSITYEIKQDNIGNVWIASEEGVLKHNSKYYKVYNTYNGLPENIGNRTTALFIDSKQGIWIGLDNGICRYNASFDRFDIIGGKTEINPSLISAITEDAIGNIWIAAYNGIWRYSVDNTLTRLVTKYFVQTLYSFDNKIIFGTPKGLFIYETISDSVTEIHFDSAVNISTINAVGKSILIGTKSDGMFKLGNRFQKIVPVVLKNRIASPITDIVADQTGNIYIATDGKGLYYVNNNFDVLNHYEDDVNNPTSLSSNGIYDVEIGNENILWIATYGGGINVLDANKLLFEKIQHRINDKNSIISNFTRSIAEDKNGNIWFGTKKGISIWNLKKDSWKHISSLSDNKNIPDIVLALEADGAFMWVGTYNNGFFKVNINNYKRIHYNSDFKDDIIKSVYTIFKDSQGVIWVGGIREDLTVLRKNKKISTYPIRQVKYITENNKGEILIAGRQGVYIVDAKNSNFRLIEGLQPNRTNLAYSTVNAVYETKNNELILATNGVGLVYYNLIDKKIRKLNRASGLASDIVQGVLVQGDSNIWVSTTKGLAHIITTEKDTIINIFDKKDGLASTEFNFGSFTELSNGLFAFGGVNGVSIFNPNQIKAQDYKPIIVFDEFKLFNKKLNPGSEILKKHINQSKNIELKSSDNSIEIGFTGVSHSSASKIKYSWILDGFDEVWTTPSYTNFATYTNLNAGVYTFRVRALDKFGNFGIERTLQVKIHSPWWKTREAYFFYVLLFIGLLWLLVYLIRVIVNKKTADDQIDFYNNITHEIKTPLTILLSSLDNVTENVNVPGDSKKRIKTTIKRINSLFEQMLNFHRVTSEKRIAQEIEKIELESCIFQIVNSFKPLLKEKNLEIRINNDWKENYFYFDKAIFNKIIHNLVSNAIKYSFDKGIIRINLRKSKSGLLDIDIIDTGLGIPKDQQKYILKRYYRARNVINSQRPGTGLGLIMVKKLIEKTGGTISFESEENKGTTFNVQLKSLKNKYSKRTDVQEDSLHQITNTIDVSQTIVEFSDSKILIVEDNDELRDVLVNTLGVYFQIYEAKNGKEGLEIANQIYPDLILTDLIMPVMDGMTMSKRIKGDINLNHIPVFMLTVMQASSQKLESAESGVTTYFTKPVDIKYLLAKMINTLKWQKKLRNKFVLENDAETASLFRNKQDEEFLLKLEKTILENLGNDSFSVHDLSSSFGMSRTSLYMKLKNLVDLSPQDFVIHTKLKQAKNLLIKGELSIKEVAYSSGFSNPKYFSTSFKKFYKQTPSAFLDSLQKD